MLPEAAVSPTTPAFVTLEGVEGCGKSTQILKLARFLSQAGVPHRVTREPGGCPVGDAVRGVLLDPDHRGMHGITELLLYAAARHQHLTEVIEPALAAGHTVLCDRYRDATRAYQGYGRGLSLDVIEAVHRLPGLDREADLTLLLDHPVEPALARARQRQDQTGDRLTRFEDEEIAFHQRVRDGYLAVAAGATDRVVVVDACGSVNEVQQRLRQALAAHLRLTMSPS